MEKELITKTFKLDRSVIGKYLKEGLEKLEKNASVCAKFAHTGSDNKEYQVKHYCLELIFKIGYKIDDSKTLIFKNWVENILHELKQENAKRPLPIEVFEDGDVKLEVTVSPLEDTI